MVATIDFSADARKFTPVETGELTVVTPGIRFQTPHKFHTDTLLVFVNGIRVQQGNNDGFTVIDDQTFDMKENVDTYGQDVSVFYVRKEG